jgi:hypothetical protein
VGVLTETKIRLIVRIVCISKEKIDLLGLGDSLVDVCAEEEISSSGLLDNFIKSWLVNGEIIRVPSVNSGLVEIDNGNGDIRAGSSVDFQESDRGLTTSLRCCGP